MWKLSRHILLRIRERGYTHAQILHIVNLKTNVLIVQSPRDKEVDLCFGFVDSKYILVAANRAAESLITVRPMRDKEKQEYKKEFDDV